MNTPTYIPVETLCLHYQIEIAFLDRLLELQLIEVQTIEETICIHEDHLSDLELRCAPDHHPGPPFPRSMLRLAP